MRKKRKRSLNSSKGSTGYTLWREVTTIVIILSCSVCLHSSPWCVYTVCVTPTLCDSVLLVEQLGLTVRQDVDLRRFWALANTRRHQSIQVLHASHLAEGGHCESDTHTHTHDTHTQILTQTHPHPYELQVGEGTDGVVRTVAGRAGGISQLKRILGRTTLGRHWRLVHWTHIQVHQTNAHACTHTHTTVLH